MAETGKQNNQNKNGDWVSWTLIVILFGCGIWWIALPLLFIKLFAPDTRQKTARPSAVNPPQAQARPFRQESRAGEAARKVVRSPEMKTSTARLLRMAGAVIAALGAYLAISPIGIAAGGAVQSVLWELLKYLAMVVGGLGMVFSGFAMERTIRRYNQYLRVVGDQEAVTFEQLSLKLGFSEKRVVRDLQRMVEKGCFGKEAYLNMAQGCLVRSRQADAVFQQRRAQAEQRPPQEAEEGYSGILRNIRRINDQIADPELSAKIDRLEEISSKIFKAMEDDPKKRSRMDTFLDYYLPTTQKLLAAYAEFEGTGVEGENLRSAKENIRRTMDSLIAGFEHQLDELYKADAMDVNSDIRVMETMLRRETASVEQDFGLGSQPQTAKAKPSSGPAEVDLGGTAAQEET